MRTADGATALLDPPASVEAPAVDAGGAPVTAAVELVSYEVLLLAGEPRRHSCVLPAGLEAGTDVEVAGELWTVADVRAGREGASALLVCIYAA